MWQRNTAVKAMLDHIEEVIVNPICLKIGLKYYSIMFLCGVIATKYKWSCAEYHLLQTFAEAS